MEFKIMINPKDNVYKKHEDCNSVLRFNEKQKKYRLFCTDHNKWLFTLTNQEVNQYYQLLDQGVIEE